MTSLLLYEIRSDILFLFRTRFGMVSFLFHPMFKNDSCKMILLSSSTRGSKLILKRWFAHLTGLTLDCQTCPVSVLHLKASQTWFYSGLTLENQSNLVLFRSYTWKLVKLVIQILSHAYLPRLPVWLCFDFVTHTYLIGLTTLMPIWLGFEILWKLWYVWIIFFLSEGFSKAFIGYKTFFLLCISVSDKKTCTWCKVSWLCMNETSKHLNSFFIWIRFIPLF